MQVVSKSPLETKKIAAKLAADVLKRRPGAQAFIIALKGELGAGKTTFVQGFVGSLGVREKIKSPTFLLVKNYKLTNSRFTDIYHVDCYRVENWKDLEPLEIKHILHDPNAIILIEWPERVSQILPRVQVKVSLEHVSKKERRITLNI